MSFSNDPWAQSFPSASYGLPLAPPGKRFLAWFLNWLIAAFSFGIVWLVWWLIIVNRGLTPGRQIMKLVIVDQRTFEEVTPGRAFVRGTLVFFVLFQVIASFLGSVFFGLGFLFTCVSAALMFRASRQTLWDLITGTNVGIKG
jgi:hypothetical protein